MNIFLFIAGIFVSTFFLGKLIEKIRVPWIFASLLIGSMLAIYNPFESITTSESFTLLAQLGMYFLLFLVGYELDIGKLKKKRNFIFRSTIFIIFLEGILGSLLIHFVFGYDWLISFIVALSFATVGEAILIPILHEFKLINTNLGQSIIGIGTADDVIEILLLLFVSVFIGANAGGDIVTIILALAILTVFTIGFRFISKKSERFQYFGIETMFLFILFVFFLFIGIGIFASAAPIAAILAGATVRLFIHDDRLTFVDNELKSLTYGFFAPIFFVWIGLELDVKYLITAPLLILAIVVVSNGAKIIGSYIMGRKELGTRGSILLGIGLSVRFSTSIIIVKFLLDSNIIGSDLFSIIIATSIVFKFIIPVLFSWLTTRWRYAIN